MSDTTKWILGILLSGSGIVWMTTLIYKLGRTAERLDSVARDMLSIKMHSDRVPILETRVETLENVVARVVEKTSDIKDLVRGSIPDAE